MVAEYGWEARCLASQPGAHWGPHSFPFYRVCSGHPVTPACTQEVLSAGLTKGVER